MTGLDDVLAWHVRGAAVHESDDALRVGTGGLRLGTFATGGPALLDLFRPQSVTVTAFLDVTIAVVLALRARAAGARVVARDDDAAWQAAAMATREEHPIVLLGPDDELPRGPGTFERPIVVFDAVAEGPGNRRSLPPWWAHVALPRQIEFRTLSAASGADLVIFGRLSHQQANLVANTWRLPAQGAEAFRLLLRWQLGVVTPGRHAVVELALEQDELQLQASAAGFQDRAARVRRGSGRGGAGADSGREAVPARMGTDTGTDPASGSETTTRTGGGTMTTDQARLLTDDRPARPDQVRPARGATVADRANDTAERR
jgi:hypothetical protein